MKSHSTLHALQQNWVPTSYQLSLASPLSALYAWMLPLQNTHALQYYSYLSLHALHSIHHYFTYNICHLLLAASLITSPLHLIQTFQRIDVASSEKWILVAHFFWYIRFYLLLQVPGIIAAFPIQGKKKHFSCPKYCLTLVSCWNMSPSHPIWPG